MMLMNVILLLKVWRERTVWDLQTVQKDSVAPVISGPKSASPSWKKVRCAPSTRGKAPTVWRYSSAATVRKACPAERRAAASPRGVSTRASGTEPTFEEFSLGLDRRTWDGKLDSDYSRFCSGFLHIVFCRFNCFSTELKCYSKLLY